VATIARRNEVELLLIWCNRRDNISKFNPPQNSMSETAMGKTMVRTTSTVLLLLILVTLAAAQAATSSESEMNARFSKVLGTDVDKVVQHYYLVKMGGVIELTAKDPNDTATITALRKYLEAQKALYEKGKNDSDAEVHGKIPDGLATMKKMRNDITFYSTETDSGAVLRMFSVNDQARQAVHDFMKFQISEHKTGDSPTVDQ